MKQRIVYFGSGAFGLPTLQQLCQSHDVAMIVSQPDRPAGRGGKTRPTPIAEWATEHVPNTPLVREENVNVEAVRESIRAVSADAWVIIAFGQKLSNELCADRMAMNLHASLLPRWRGAAPINAAMLAGDAETGNSVITIAERMDAGLVLGQSRRPLDPALTAGELHDLLAADGPALILDVLERHRLGTLEGQTQDESLVTKAPKLSRADGWVDFTASAEECRRRIHALTPWPGVTATFQDANLKLLRCQPEEHEEDHGTQAPPGTILSATEGTVRCGQGILRLIQVQPAGGKAMAWQDFARGRRIEDGQCMTGRTP